jgi:hypothetical protein
VGLGLACSWGPLAQAAEVYREGEALVRLDTTFSVGAALRASDRDSDGVYVGNGGSASNPEFLNRDDGNLNYDQWDFYSASAKALFELDVQWRNYGAFVRSNVFYDALGDCADCTQRTDLSSRARNRRSMVKGGVIGSQLLLLDAYLEGSWEVAERPLELRVGRQVVSWGQGIFIQGGINQTNAIDVARVRSPGVDFGKEALFPAAMVKLSARIFEDLGLESYYQFEWNETFLDPKGAYFAQSDTSGRGADALYFGSSPLVGGGSTPIGDPGSNPVIPMIPALPPVFPGFPGCGGALPPCTSSDLQAVAAGIPRASDETPDSQGQLGVALRYFLEPIQSEIAAYYIRYHSKTPVVSFHGEVFQVGPILANQPTAYANQYAPDVELVGLSFDTEVFDIALGAEVSYRWRDPVVISPRNFVLLGTPALAAPGDPFFVRGYVRERRWQYQLNGQYNIPPGNRLFGPLVELLGMDNVIVIGEAALVHYPELDRQCGPTDFAIGCTPYQGPPDNPSIRMVDEVSWGYQLLLQAPYSNPFGIPNPGPARYLRGLHDRLPPDLVVRLRLHQLLQRGAVRRAARPRLHERHPDVPLLSRGGEACADARQAGRSRCGSGWSAWPR